MIQCMLYIYIYRYNNDITNYFLKPFTRVETRNTKCIWVGWGVVGWGGVITFMLTCTPTSCYARVIFSCACTHTSCYAMVGWGGVITFMLTCTPTSCYARVIFSCACTDTSCYAMVGWGGLERDIYIYEMRSK